MIINLPMNSHTTLFQRPFLFAALVAVFCAPLAQAREKKAPSAKAANQYPAFDTHPNEQVTIAIDPCDDQRNCDFFRLPYVRHSLIPVRVIITNDSDTALNLDQARMQFISANSDKIPAATLDDINRRLFSTNQAKGTKIPLTPITIHHTPVDKKITDDDADFGFQGTTVNPHSTVAGYLFYDVKGLDDPPLKDAEVYIKMIHTLDGKKELFAFSIPFNKWHAASTTPAK